MKPSDFVERTKTFISILNDTIGLLENEDNIRDLQVTDTSLDNWLEWANEHIGTLAIELDQNLNPSLRGDTNPNDGNRFRLE